MKPDGGPAFPHGPVTQEDGRTIHYLGMSLRDYFAAHAPSNPWKHFRPNYPPCPKGKEPSVFCSETGNTSYSNSAERWRWQKGYDIAHTEQWPWFYADAMLSERNK